MKKILIVNQDMNIGGAQKSLLSFLCGLAESPWMQDYEIDLLLIQPKGPFYSRIPPCIRQLPASGPLYWMGAHFSPRLFFEKFSLRGILGETRWLLGQKRFPRQLSRAQKLWLCWKNLIPPCPQTYDAAISYIDGPPNYYVMEKVSARKKVLWVHNEYQKLGYDAAFDRPYFEAADAVVTISETCRACILEEFPQLAAKTHILENITFSQDVLERSREGDCPEFSDAQGLKLLSVGRLHPQKGLDLAIDAAAILRQRGIAFRWLVVGEGSQRAALQEQIDRLGLSDCFRLIGPRDNPYVYMARCDILVQPSRWEGKSLVLDEAKVLCKPIVATDYATVGDSITHGQTGWVTGMTGPDIAGGILRLLEEPSLMQKLTDNLRQMPAGNEKELQRYIRIMLS